MKSSGDVNIHVDYQVDSLVPYITCFDSEFQRSISEICIHICEIINALAKSNTIF